MDSHEAAGLIQKLCSTVLDNKTPLGITKEEASSLMESVIATEDFREKIRKIRSNREKVKLTHSLRLQKYFETLGHNGIIERICFDNSSRFAFSGGADGIIKCWDIQKGMVIRSLYSHASMISDLCISKDGRILVSVDYQGVLNIWCLSEFRILHSIQLSSEAIFCEFTYFCAIHPDEDFPAQDRAYYYHIFIILADGIVKTIEFSRDSIVSEKENSFMLGESIKAICITDGGRFVICGGWWPFFLIYDTKDLDSVIVLENFRIQALCAAKNSLKFAASSDNQICSYTFYCEGSLAQGNFNRRRSGDGYWKKHVNTIDNDYFVEWLCYLPSFLLVASCTDDVIRIYEDDQMMISFEAEGGSIYSHPFKDVFAVVGTKLTIYQISRSEEFSEFSGTDSSLLSPLFKYNLSSSKDQFAVSNFDERHTRVEMVFSEDIYINLNDCQFSDDGRFFITCDDQGVVRAYSIERPIRVPEEQFFLADLDRSNSHETFGATYNMHRQKNKDWAGSKYSIAQACMPESVKVENLAAFTLERDKLSEAKFKKLYFSGNVSLQESGEPQGLVDEESSGDTSTATDYTKAQDSSYCSDMDDGDGSSPLRILRRASLSSGLKGSLRSGGRTRPRRAIIVSESSASSSEDNYMSGGSSKSRKKLQKLKKYDRRASRRHRRLIVSEESSDPMVEYDGREKKASDDHPRTIRKAAQNRMKLLEPEGSSRVLRKSAAKRLFDGNDNVGTASISRRSRKLIVSSPSESDSTSSEDIFSQPRSRRCVENCSHAERNALRGPAVSQVSSRNKERVPRRASVAANSLETLGSQNDIDPEFEDELCAFSLSWLVSCSIYENTEVFFNSESYREFVSLEPRIRYGRHIPKSGFYRVSSLKMMSIGKIPYISVGLGDYTCVSFYEYPDSKGILCTKDQYCVKKGDRIKVWVSEHLFSGLVTDTNDMNVRVGKVWHPRSRIAVEYEPLNVTTLTCSPHAIKPLFGMDRTGKRGLKVPTNYAIVNTKIENHLYSCKHELLSDLEMIATAAKDLGEVFETVSSQIYQDYARMLLKDK